MRDKLTTVRIREMKKEKRKIVMVTAYDYPGARTAETAGVDMILVGDSLGMVVLGYDTTIPVTMEDMIHHTKAVRRGAGNTMIVCDLPFLSYHTSAEDAVRNAGRLLQEGMADAVKLEGGRDVIEQIRRIVQAQIPVMGHLGLTPQSVYQLGGFRVQGKDVAGAKRILEDALLLEEAGCFAVVLECVPDRLAELITEKLSIPTIGIGAGKACDGQVLVFHDLLGINDRHVPKFAKNYTRLFPDMVKGIQMYAEEVRDGRFPTAEYSFQMPEGIWAELKKELERE
jgi:3-methyl-2-oxobutanoate hydroxymethyltransferase